MACDMHSAVCGWGLALCHPDPVRRLQVSGPAERGGRTLKDGTPEYARITSPVHLVCLTRNVVTEPGAVSLASDQTSVWRLPPAGRALDKRQKWRRPGGDVCGPH